MHEGLCAKREGVSAGARWTWCGRKRLLHSKRSRRASCKPVLHHCRPLPGRFSHGCRCSVAFRMTKMSSVLHDSRQRGKVHVSFYTEFGAASAWRMQRPIYVAGSGEALEGRQRGGREQRRGREPTSTMMISFRFLLRMFKSLTTLLSLNEQFSLNSLMEISYSGSSSLMTGSAYWILVFWCGGLAQEEQRQRGGEQSTLADDI